MTSTWAGVQPAVRRRFFEWRVILVIVMGLILIGVGAALSRTLFWTETSARVTGPCTTTITQNHTSSTGHSRTVTQHCPVTWTTNNQTHTATLNIGSGTHPSPDGTYHVLVNNNDVTLPQTKWIAIALLAAGPLLIIAITLAQLHTIRASRTFR